jgi:hypothetical protein
MSLYNNVHSRVTGFSGPPPSPADKAGEMISGALGGGVLGGIAASAVLQHPTVDNVLKKAGQVLDTANTVKDALSGDFGALLKLVPGGWSGIQNALFMRATSPLWGGISVMEAKRLYQETQYAGHVKKNLFLLKVSSPLAGDVSKVFNIFATDVEYSPFIISGEKTKIGGAVLDRAEGCEPAELTITTFDDQYGTLKNWFSEHHAAIAHRDGTLGLPANYAVRIEIWHGIVMEGNKNAWADIGQFRPANLNISLTRREDALEELQVTFSQMDTFMKP